MIPHNFTIWLVFLLGINLAATSPAWTAERVLDPRLHHLRHGPVREWDDFPKQAEGPKLTLHFKAGPNKSEWTLRLRQQDVRQAWKVLLNSKELARLPPDENDMVLYLPIPPGRLTGDNTLTIEQAGTVAEEADDSVSLESVRQAMAKIPGCLTEDIRSERDEH